MEMHIRLRSAGSLHYRCLWYCISFWISFSSCTASPRTAAASAVFAVDLAALGDHLAGGLLGRGHERARLPQT